MLTLAHSPWNACKKLPSPRQAAKTTLFKKKGRPNTNSAALHVGGTAFVVGDNVEGQLGISAATAQKAVRLEGLPDIASVAAGELHSLLVDVEGSVWGFGASSFGETGLGVDADIAPPKKINFDHRVVAAAAGKSHSLLLSNHGQVYSFGDGESGQLGYPTRGSKEVPTLIDALRGVNVVRILCGSKHSFALDDNGVLYSWGNGHFAQHGQGVVDVIQTPTPLNAFTDDPVVHVAAGLYHSTFITKSQKLLVVGGFKVKAPGQVVPRTSFALIPVPVIIDPPLAPGTRWNLLTSGIGHSVVTSEDGHTYSWGQNTGGALGSALPSGFSKAVPLPELDGVVFRLLAAGSYHNMGVDVNGQVWGWGQGSDYQLAMGRSSPSVPTKIDLGLPPNHHILGIAAGWAHTIVLAKQL